MRIAKNNKAGVLIGLLFFIFIQLSFSQQDSSIQINSNKDTLSSQKTNTVSNDTTVKSDQKKSTFLKPSLFDSTNKKPVMPVDNKLKDKITFSNQPRSIIPNFKTDSANRSGFMSKFKNKIKFDSSTTKTLLKKIIPKTTGTISAGYDYGIIPFAANIKYPMGYFSSQGNVGFSLLGIPLAATYYYSDLKYVSGLNNYFRVAFDANAYKNVTQNKNFEKLDEEKEALNSLNQIKQQLTQKLAFAQHMQNGLPNSSVLNSQLSNYTNRLNTDKYKNQVNPSLIEDSLKKLIPNSQQDSLKTNVNIPKLTLADSINQLTGLIKKNDSISKKVEHYTDALQKIEQQIKSVQNKLELLKNPQKLATQNPYMSKINGMLSGLKKFEIGMCYPNYSTFLVNGSSLKGINVEWEKKFYVAFTYGKTINTIMTTNNIIQNQLQTARNAYNFFDFSNVKDSRKIAALKFGYGKKEGTHLYAGFLYGIGLPSYVSQIPQNSLEKNLVLELDGKIAINASNSVELIYGKSTLFQSGLPVTGENIPGGFPFTNYRSNAGLIRYSSVIKKTKTKLIATGRLVDPFFNSYGVGFMRSDNLRYELKIDQEISRKIKFSGFYRKDRDNLLNTFTYTTQLQTMGATLSIKIDKRFLLKASFMPVIQNIMSKDTGLKVTHPVNNISNVVLTYTPKTGNITSVFTAMYSYYSLSGTGGKSSFFQNYLVNNSTTFNPHFKNDFSLNYFQNNDNDSLNNSTFLFSNSLSYASGRGIIITGGIKLAYNSLIKSQTGGLLKVNIPLVSHFHVELLAEKLVLGDFYNSYNLEQIRKFPFYGYAKLIISW